MSGVAVTAFKPAVSGRALEVALVGAGTQARSHVPMLGHVIPGLLLRVFDVDPTRGAVLAEWARTIAGIGGSTVSRSAREAVEGADVVVTVASFGPVRQVMTNDWLAPGATVIAVDYATYCAAEVARQAALFLVDDRAQFLANRDAGNFDGYPDPMTTLGEALIAGTSRPAGRIVVSHLGVGLADVVFGRAIVTAAEAAGRGTLLER